MSLHGREERGTAWYRLTRDNRRRPKENTDVGATRSTAGRWRTEAQGSQCREGGAEHHRAVRGTTGRTLEPTNGLTRHARLQHSEEGQRMMMLEEPDTVVPYVRICGGTGGAIRPPTRLQTIPARGSFT